MFHAKRSFGHRAAALIFIVSISVLFFLPGLAAAAEAADSTDASAVVRVGYFYNGDFMHKADDGSYEGYDIDYYYTIAGYTDWNIQFIEYDSLNSALSALGSGKIDILSGLSKTPEREGKYLVSAQKMCSSHIAVQTRADDDRFAIGDTASLTDLTCGILKGSNVVTLYTDWCAEKGLTPHIVEYDSIELRNNALMSGEVDAIAAGSTIEGAQRIAEFPSLDLYFMFSSNQPSLKSQLDKAMEILALEEPSYASDLYNTYFPASRNDSPSFNASEKAFINTHQTIRVAVPDDDAPFSSTDKSGKAVGILPEYFSHLSEIIGVRFEYTAFHSKDEICDALTAGNVDLAVKVEDNIYEANKLHIILTDSYLQMNIVQITRAGTSSVSSIAVPQCNYDYVTGTMAGTDSSAAVLPYSNSEECFHALKAGNVDSVICTQPAATWLLNRNRASDYVVSAFGGSTFNVSCALNYGRDGNTLRSILNKTIATDSGYISQLITSDTLKDSAGLSDIFDRLPVSFLAASAVVLSLLLAGTIIGLIVIIRRRRTERKLARQQIELTAAMEANNARRAFFGTISHDMRTPLNGIIGFANLASKSDDPAAVKNYLAKIRTSGTILNELVNDMLITSRLENDKYSLIPTPCDIREVIDSTLDPVREMAKEKNITLSCSMSEMQSRRVTADRLSIQKILLNLLSNAIKYTPEGGTVSLCCRTEQSAGETPCTIITVVDTGNGISSEFLPHVFEPFSQENPSGTNSSGSGLGLSIVKSIVDAMNGTITVKSEYGKGSEFTVRLYLPEDTEAPVQKGQAQSADDSTLKGKHALVCEDNELNMEIIRTVLSSHGIESDGAPDGRKGLEAFEKSEPGSFDFILLDLRMPVMDGISTARAIRALDRIDAGTVPIFAVSADAYPEDIKECRNAGMNAHISKPIDEGRLIQTVKEYL